MAKKPKAPSDEKPTEDRPVPAEDGKLSGLEPKKKTRAAAAIGKKKKPAATRKPPTKQATASDSKSAAGPAEPTDEEIRLRAYFLAERRHRLSLPGDSNHDWIEARRQLMEEAQKR